MSYKGTKHRLFRNHRPGRHLLRRPVLERTIHRSRFQGQANLFASCSILNRPRGFISISSVQQNKPAESSVL
jgi:hypothetical protein